MEIVGRERELESAGRILTRSGSEGRIVVIEGEPGIGKTAVWKAAAERARAAGSLVLSCAPARSEARLALTGLRDLLAEAFPTIAGDLSPPQRHALAVALLVEEPVVRQPEQGTVAVAFLSALRLLARRGRVVLALDDAQWLDDDSTAVLRYALRRLGDDDVAVVVARRPLEGADDPLELDGLAAGSVLCVELGPVTIGALGKILHEAVGTAFPRPIVQRIHDVTGGNAFYALELAQALGDDPSPLRLGAPVPLPRSGRALVAERLAELPVETLEVLSFAAASSHPTVALLASALGVDVEPQLRVASDARVIGVEDGVVRFVHPLLAAAVEALAPARLAVHERLAAVVADVEERARHFALAAVEPDEERSGAVEAGARAALARGSPAAAAELARHAGRITPPADVDARRRRELLEADSAFAAGDTRRASTVLQGLAAESPPGVERATALARLARLQHFEQDIRGSVELLYAALDEAGDGTALRGEIEEGLAWGLLLLRSDLPGAIDHARSATRIAETRGDRAALAEGLAAQAVAALVRGESWEQPVRRAIELEEATRGLRVLRQPSFALGYCLSCSDELDDARVVFTELLRRAEHDGDESSVPSILNHLTLVECLAGHFEETERLADEGLARARESRQLPTQVSILAKRALARGRRGDDAAARELSGRALELGAIDPTAPEAVIARGGETAVWALGATELASGRPEAAADLLAPLARTLVDAGVREPGEVRCLPDAVEALVALGRLEEADGLTNELEGWAAVLDRASATGAAARCRGLLLAARGDGPGAVAALTDASDAYEATALPFEQARTLVALGAQQRRTRQRREARRSLERAESIFSALGAMHGVGSARAEIARLGGRAPSSGALTATEQRVAELVADGRTNREVAAELVLSVHTVEAALTSIYRKLDVRSRTEMARNLAGKD